MREIIWQIEEEQTDTCRKREREKGTRETFMTAFRKGIFSNELAKQSVINEALASVCVLTVSIYFCGSHTNKRTHSHSQAPTFIHSHSQQFSRWSFATLPQITAHTWQRSNNNDNKHDTLFHLGIWDLLSFICTSNTSINMCISVCVCVIGCPPSVTLELITTYWNENPRQAKASTWSQDKMPQLRLQLHQCR